MFEAPCIVAIGGMANPTLQHALFMRLAIDELASRTQGRRGGDHFNAKLCKLDVATVSGRVFPAGCGLMLLFFHLRQLVQPRDQHRCPQVVGGGGTSCWFGHQLEVKRHAVDFERLVAIRLQQLTAACLTNDTAAVSAVERLLGEAGAWWWASAGVSGRQRGRVLHAQPVWHGPLLRPQAVPTAGGGLLPTAGREESSHHADTA